MENRRLPRTLSAERLREVLKTTSKTSKREDNLESKLQEIEQISYRKAKTGPKSALSRPPLPTPQADTSVEGLMALIQSIATEERSRSSGLIDSLVKDFNSTVLDIETKARKEVSKAKESLEAAITEANTDMELRIRDRIRRGIGRLTAPSPVPTRKTDPSVSNSTLVSAQIEATRYRIKDLSLRLTRFESN